MPGQQLAERRAVQRGRCILMCMLIALVLHIWAERRAVVSTCMLMCMLIAHGLHVRVDGRHSTADGGARMQAA